ncbi:MAG: hypothetical protein JW795_04000, partial [Chitinivibrionales bacterium]|nr:hypothetical protein [Chitinivibrionales bacterium]
MKQVRGVYFFLTAIFFFCTGGVYGDRQVMADSAHTCETVDSLWAVYRSVKQELVAANPSFTPLNEECFIALLKRIAASNAMRNSVGKLVALIQHFCRTQNQFDQELFGRIVRLFYRNGDQAGGGQEAQATAALIDEFQHFNGPLRQRMDDLQRKGLFQELDDLYEICSRLKLLDGYEIIKWARVKIIIGDYEASAALFCAVSGVDGHFLTVSRSELGAYLVELNDIEAQKVILSTYKICFRKAMPSQKRALLEWLVTMYDRVHLFSEEIGVIIELEDNEPVRGQQLLALAHQQFAQNQFSNAAQASSVSFSYLTNEILQQQAAQLAYKSFMRIGNTDSNLVWLEKVAKKDEKSSAAAAVLYQNKGRFDKAQTLITMLRRSFVRDTIQLRHYLFQKSLDSSRLFFAECSRTPFWQTHTPDRVLWRLRIALFSAATDTVVAMCDSIAAVMKSGSPESVQEMLSYSLAVQRLGAYPAAFEAWTQLVYALYRKELITVPHQLYDNQWPQQVVEFVAVAAVELLMQFPSELRVALECIDTITARQASPQLEYYKALL